MTNEKQSTKELTNRIVYLSKKLNIQSFSAYIENLKTLEVLSPHFTIEEALLHLLTIENDIKEQNKYKYRIKIAAFPVIKTMDTFEFSEQRLPDLRKDVVMELSTCDFIKNKRNVVAIGNSGTGKSHLLTAIAIEAIRKGYTVRFKRASDLVTQMTEAASEKQLTQYIKRINACDLLYIDELGFLMYDIVGANLLFQIFAARCESKSTMVTSNLEFSKWVSFLGKDEHMSAALIGRLVYMSTVLNMNGENYRAKSRTKGRGIDTTFK
jgi:DNA replication protein DnaC